MDLTFLLSEIHASTKLDQSDDDDEHNVQRVWAQQLVVTKSVHLWHCQPIILFGLPQQEVTYWFWILYVSLYWYKWQPYLIWSSIDLLVIE